MVRALALAAALAAALIAGCGGNAESARKPAAPPAVLITASPVQSRTLEVYEEVIGSLENVIDPRVAAEVPGRVTRLHGYTGKKVRRGELLAEIDVQDFQIQSKADQAEIARLASLLEQQERVVQRQLKLVEQGFISKNALDEALAQRSALRESLAAASAKAEATRRNVGRARVVAPVDGEVEAQIVAAGDYVKVGDPLFRLVSVQELRAHLFLPEAAATRVRPGLRVRLTSPAAPDRPIEARIDEIKPTVVAASRAIDAIVKFRGDGTVFRGGGTVNARIVLAVREGALMVPEQSVVLRPAGKVVYVLNGNVVEQRVVETGVRQDGMHEILKGVSAGEVVAVDGAGFLTDGAVVALPKPRPAASEAKGAPPQARPPSTKG
jgi:membrane fusion protein, multidrug efflux system